MAMATLIGVFDHYAAPEGKKDTLTKNEVKTLLQKELPEVFEAASAEGDVEKLVESLDKDGNTEVDFCEFLKTVAALTWAYKNLFQK